MQAKIRNIEFVLTSIFLRFVWDFSIPQGFTLYHKMLLEGMMFPNFLSSTELQDLLKRF